MTVANPFSRLKECLADWRAPGHIPWGDIPDQTTSDDKWLPEGSLYSPEDFSRALGQARARYVSVDVAQSEQEPSAIVDASLNKHITTTERMDFGSSGTVTHMELVDMMQELKDLKTFFEDTPQEVERIIPSLMISNSHCTFPLSLDSCQSFTLKPANLANRRGKNPPPPLLLKNRTPSSELPYSSIPVASLGSPSSYSPDLPDVNLSNTSGLRIEDMINNLRLQCSSMVIDIDTPPVDISLNSQSCSAAYEPVKKSMGAEVVEFAESELVKKPIEAEVADFAESSIESPANNAPSEFIGNQLDTLTIPPGPQKRRVKVSKPDKISSATKNLQTAKYARTDTPDKKPEVLSKYTSPPLLLRSSLVKHPTFRPRSPKSVRFALSPLEFEKDVTSLMYDDVWRSSQISVRDHYGKAPVKNITTPRLNPASDEEGLEEESTHLIRQNTKSWHPTSTTFRVSSAIKTKERIKSIIIKPPVRHSMVPNIFYGNTDKDNDRPQRLLESRGRHSLNRIIKGPIFSGKEHKRATVSKAFSARGTVTPDGVALEFTQRKSRMPVPLRNILTRFK
jgi:hypothetical protein